MTQYIDKSAIIVEIKKRLKEYQESADAYYIPAKRELKEILSFIDTLEVKEVDLELENENNKPKITIGTKIRSKTNPNIILSIISDDCHGDEFECSNGSVLSLKQIEKYYDLII